MTTYAEAAREVELQVPALYQESRAGFIQSYLSAQKGRPGAGREARERFEHWWRTAEVVPGGQVIPDERLPHHRQIAAEAPPERVARFSAVWFAERDS